jgi:hypothetical protein
MKIFARVIISFLIVIFSNSAALPWGDAPSHFAIGYDVLQEISSSGPISNEGLFIRANACPDIANTQLFKYFGLDYVHSLGFAEDLYDVAVGWSREDWQDIAFAWGAHLSADNILHQHMTDEQPMHQLTELAIDTVVYYEGSPLQSYTELEWEQYNVGSDCCSPWLIYLASRRYRQTHPRATLVYPWLVRMALDSLRTTINLEYGYIKAKGGPELSNWFLESIPDDVLEGEWEIHYDNSVNAAVGWIKP